MYKLMIATLCMFALGATAQKQLSFQYTDSITYQSYLSGNWDQLLNVGKQALEQQIDFKRLRQRMGYAYLLKADYMNAQKHYQKALAFDTFDADTRAYLYYCASYMGDEASARYQAGKLGEDFCRNLKLKSLKLIDAVDVEYNYKKNDINVSAKSLLYRTSPTYRRFGIHSFLNYRLSLYQSYSFYQQTVGANLTKQPEYIARLNYNATSNTTFNLAYHFLSPNINGTSILNNLFYVALKNKINRLEWGISGSILSNGTTQTHQFGVRAGISLPGRSNFYFNSFANRISENKENRLIFSQAAGARIYKTLWAEGNVTLGNLKNYNDNEALYIYNSVDATTFRSGITLAWFLGKHLSVIGNYTYDAKQFETKTDKYNQYSFSGGLRWKL